MGATTQRNISKSLGGIEDLLFGFGNVTQTRGSADHTITKIDKIHVLDDLVDLALLDSDIYRTCFVLGETDLGVGFSNQYFWLADKGTLSYDGLLVVQKTGDSVGAWVADRLNLVTGNVTAKGDGPHAFGGIQGWAFFSVNKAFTSDGSSTIGAMLTNNGTLTGADGDTSRLSGFQSSADIVTQTASESIAVIAQASFFGPAITDNLTGGGLINIATNVYIADAPTGGVDNYALYIAAGVARLDGNVVLGSDVFNTVANATTIYGGGSSAILGANLVMHGEAETNADDFHFRHDTDDVIFYDASTDTLDFNPVPGTTVLALSALLATVTGKQVIDQDADDVSLNIDSEAATASTINIFSAQATSASIINVSNCNALIAGKVANFHSNSSSATARKLVFIHNQNTAAILAACLGLQQDANGPLMDFSGLTGADANSAVSTLNTSGAVTDHIQISLNGTKAWIPVSTVDPT